MNVEIGAQAAQFPEKEYINGIFVAVLKRTPAKLSGVCLVQRKIAPNNQRVKYKQEKKVTYTDRRSYNSA
jgi:hypothetical protein